MVPDLGQSLISRVGCTFILLISKPWKFQDMRSERLARRRGFPFIPFKGQAKHYLTTPHTALGTRPGRGEVSEACLLRVPHLREHQKTQ